MVNNACIAEYIWLDANKKFRSKTKVIYDLMDNNVYMYPKWDYDGSSTGQANGTSSEIVLVPIFV